MRHSVYFEALWSFRYKMKFESESRKATIGTRLQRLVKSETDRKRNLNVK